MEIIYLLIPMSIILVLVIIGAFLWAVRSKQFEDLDRRGRDILLDDQPKDPPDLP